MEIDESGTCTVVSQALEDHPQNERLRPIVAGRLDMRSQG
jgi:hypothetical protein